MKGNFRNIRIIRINKETGEIKRYSSQYDASFEGFNTSKIGQSCKILSHSYKGYFWCYEKDYNKDTYKNRLELNKKPHRYKKYKDEDIKEKICYKCNILKSIDQFHKAKNGIAGKRSDCKNCNVKRSVLNRQKLEKTPQRKLALNLRTRLIQAMRNNAKTGSAVKDLGCSIEEFKKYLENKFNKGMTWENYGIKGWHIDHIIPLCNFDLTNRDQFLTAVHYTNLQPLWAQDNLKKPKKVGYIYETSII